MTTGPKCCGYSVDEAARMLAYLSREARSRRTEPGSAKVNPQRRTQLLARAQEMAADSKARP
jgi:hypothetical protein